MKKKLSNESSIEGLISKLQEQIISLERKVDVLLNRSWQKPPEAKLAPQPFPKPFQPSANAHVSGGNRQDTHFQTPGQRDNRFPSGNRQDNHPRDRFMHKAICADCRKPCEVPFKPSEGRPVYCQVCFSRRKTGSAFKVNFASKPKAAASLQTVPISRLHAIEKTKSATNKKTAVKKKTVSKKKKK